MKYFSLIVHLLLALLSMQAASPEPDLDAFYQFGWAGRASNDRGRQITSVQLVRTSETDVTVYGFFHELAAHAVYDSAEQSLTILPQQLLSADQWNGNALWLYTEILDYENGELKNERRVPYIKFIYQPNGILKEDGTRDYVGGWIPESNYYQLEINDEDKYLSGHGYNQGWKYSLFFRNLDQAYPAAGNFKFDNIEWSFIGNSHLTDGWYKALDGIDYGPYDVETYRSISNPFLILLRNPFGINSPYASLNENTEREGYILLDISDPDCVVVRPNISNGFVCEPELEMTCNMTSTTDEGWLYYIEEKTKEEIKADYKASGMTISTMNQDGIITLPNCRYQNGYNLPRLSQWILSVNMQPIPMETVIELPDLTSVRVPGLDPTLDPTLEPDCLPRPHYYDLHGLPVAHPAPGQPVIPVK